MRILVTEDNKKLADSLRRGLENEGYAVDNIYEGDAAERRLMMYSENYDLVILDLMLPAKNGLEICKNLREANVVTPIIMLTAKDATGDKIIGLDAGADDYLVKPFAFGELLARIRALLRRPKDMTPAVLTVGDIVLDCTSKKAFIESKSDKSAEIPLTLREFSILEYFLRNPDRVLTREQIIAHVWDFSFDSFSNVVDVHIKNLRKKLGTEYGKHLETLRGVGYRFKI